jgi:hypothetical protein
VDESLPRAVTRALAVAGHDVVDVRDIGNITIVEPTRIRMFGTGRP